MKTLKCLISLSIVIVIAVSAWAVPAYRGWQERTLTDGTPITVRLVGDEFYHYWETKDGKIATMQGDGTFVVSSERRPSSKTIKNNRAKSPYMVRPIRKVGEHNMAPRGLVILVNFANVSFQTANNQAAFNDLMNSTSYTHNGAYGSVREYFRAQSNGAYVPDFDVVGPITLSNNRSTYGANTASKKGSDVDPAQMIADACTAVNSTVNFATYDNDNDGYIDFVYVIYAGEGEADGGPAESVWPHNWYVRSGAHINCQLDGKWLDNYACSAELNHSDGSRTGIGTIAHEFGHVIGMPDYYDTDYGTNDDDGVTPYKWSIMDQGSYSNEGRTPPNYSIFDKYYMGWATPKFLAKYAQANVTMTTGYSDGYQITGGTSLLAYSNTNTIYYIENRQKTGWDAYIPGSGMLVWKVKYSQTVWEDNEPNNEAGNPRYTIVPADGKSTNYGRNASDLFPTGSVTSYTPFTGCALTEIAKSSSNVTFKYNGGVSATEWSYTLYGDHCTYPDDGTVLKNAALNLTITPSSGYTLADASCWEVTMGGTPLTYGTDFTYNTGTGAFSIASVTGDVEILVEGKRTVTWNVAGVTNTTFFSEGAALVLPTKPADCSGSGGKKFVGWTANSTVTGSAPADLFSTAGTKTVTTNTTYYAVYATASAGGGSATPTKASSIAAGDRVVFVCETASKEMTSIGTYGVGTEYSTTPAGTYVFDVVTGSSEGTFSFKNGTDYISWSSGNSLAKSDTKNANSSWNVSFSSGNAIITNASTASRQLQWNAGSPRFACYTSSQTAIQLYKMSGGTTYSDYSLTCSAPEPCTHQISVSKGTPSNGDFSIDKTGSQDNCSVGGLVVTVSGITPAEGYEFGAITQTGIALGVTIDQEAKTVTYAKDVVGSSTINVTFTEKPTYKIRFYDGATKLKEEDLVSGATATPPSNPAGCTEYTFYGWWTETLASSNTTAHKVTDFTVSGAQDYYAVYSHTVTSGGGAASLTKQGSTSSFAAGDNIVIVAKGTTYALYQETVSTSYVKNWSFENSAATVGTDAKNYVTLATAATSGKWYLGDATNGYLYNTSGGNELYVKTDGSKAEWTISWNAGQSAFTIVGGRNLSCRTDLTGGNANKYRSSNGTGTGTCFFDIYKYSSGGSSTTYYTTTAECVECTNKVTLTKGTPSNGTFALDKADGEYNNCAAGGLVVTVSGITPADGYRFKEITQTGIASGVTIDQEGKTVTYAKDVKGASTINVVFELIPTYTVTWSSNGDESNQVNYYEGDAIVFPGTATGCEGKTFMGWSAVTVAEQDVAPAYTTSATMPAHDVTYYAVFAEASSGSGTPVELINEEFDNSSASDASSAITSSTFTNFSGSTDRAYKSQYGGLKLGASGGPGYITSKTLDLSSSFTVTMDVAKYGTDGGNIVVTIYNNADVKLDSKSILNANFGTGKSLSFDAATSTSKVEIATSSKRAYIDNVIITRGGGTTYSGYSTTCGASISAQNIGWMTTAAGQKVKRVINVSAKNFDNPTTLSATCANSNFSVTLGASAVPAGTTGLTTTLTVEYTPTASDTRDENVEIVLTAGDKSRTITVSGRSVPDEFLLITKKLSKWYALPANMNSGADQYDGVEVSPNDPTTPTSVAVSPSTLIYNLASVASSHYAENGHLVRLVGNNTKCLWGNKAAGATKVNIQNYAALGESNGDNYEWDLKTTDGVHYFVESPCNAEYAEGRRLAYGTKFGMYKEETVFFIVRAGCTSQPGEVNVSPRRVDATFSWVSNTTEMHIDVYTNELMTEGHLSRTASSSPYVFHELAESTDYWYKLTPGSDTECAVTGTFKTSGPIIDIVEWQENGVVLFIDKGEINPVIVIDGQEEHGSITGGGNATELFFAKYFEGSGDMKLLSIFNGTKNAISLSDYSIYIRCRGTGDGWAPASNVTLYLSSLGSINAGQEIIFFTRQTGTGDLVNCSDGFLDDKVTNCSSAESNPRWVECDGGTFSKITFNGNDPVMLYKNSTMIDIIGSQGAAATIKNCLTADNEKGWAGTVRNMDKGKSPSDPVFDAFYAATTLSPVTTQDSIDLLTAFGINLDDDEIALTTARCILFRDKRVTSGDSAVLMNETTGTTFVTFTNHDEFKSEWYGRSVCMNEAAKTAAGVTSDAQATCNSYQDIANMDYNQYYIDWTNIEEGKELSTFTSDPETKEYTIPITNMSQYACLNLRFQLKLAGEVLTEAAQQVPIVVTGNVDTNDPLFSELVIDQSTHLPSYSHSVDRCRDCNVVVLGTGTLTKGPDSDEKDVPEIGNLKIYPGGKLIVPTSTEYTVNSLSFRRQEDAVSTADVQGTLNIKNDASKHVYLDFRIDPTNWHYFSLPYDCNVADIRYANPDETDIPVLGTNFLLKYYDGDKRAATQAGGCWEMVSPDATLKKGLGYIFAIPGDGKVKTEFRFPMANGVIADDQNDKLVQGIYGYGCDKDYTQVRANHRGWNLVGNPYFLPYQSSIENPVLNGEIVEDHSVDPWDGHYKFNDPVNDLRYIVEPVNNGWSEYIQVPITNYSMRPFTSYFVQIGGTNPAVEQGIQFVQTQVTGRSSIVRRSPAEYEETEDTHPVWCAVTLTNVNGEKDETTMLISNDFTDNYDIMNDLVKMRGSYYQYKQITTKPVLASRNNEGEMAFNALPDSSALAGIPLNYFAAFQGEYVFAYDNKYDRDGEVKEVKLLDTKTNTWYDLMSESYAFTTNREDNTTRFILSIRVERKTPHVATDLDLTNTPDDRPRKILINGHVYIQRGGAIYDITGKQVLNY